MEIKTIKVGPIRTNCYLVTFGKVGAVIDPGDEIENILRTVGETKIKAIILTHGHWDHVTEAFKLKEKLDAPVMIHEKDEAMMAFSTKLRADRLLKDGDELEIAPDEKLRVIHTPGHSSGGICLYSEKRQVIFTGDTLFDGDYGRVDLPGSSPQEMESSLRKLLQLPPETRVYPGHGRATTIGDERNLLE